MFFMVHGFFGKFAVKDLAINDVIEVTILDDFFYLLVDTVQKLSVINKQEQQVLDDIISRRSNILPCEIHSIFLRAIIKRCNLGVVVTPDKHELESIALVIRTAQRYERDVYFI